MKSLTLPGKALNGKNVVKKRRGATDVAVSIILNFKKIHGNGAGGYVTLSDIKYVCCFFVIFFNSIVLLLILVRTGVSYTPIGRPTLMGT